MRYINLRLTYLPVCNAHGVPNVLKMSMSDPNVPKTYPVLDIPTKNLSVPTSV